MTKGLCSRVVDSGVGVGTKLCWTLRTRKNYDVGIKNVNKHIQDAIKNVNQCIKDAVENAIFERRR